MNDFQSDKTYTDNKRVSVFLLITTLILSVLSIGSIGFLLNIEKFLYSDIFLFNPQIEEVKGYGTSQKLYMYVDDIQKTNETDYKIFLKTLDNGEGQKTIEVDINESTGGWDGFVKNVMYWDDQAQEMYDYTSKPAGISEGVEIADQVIVHFEYFNGESEGAEVQQKTNIANIYAVIK